MKEVVLSLLKKLTFVIVTLLTPVFSSAQNWPFELWHEGKVVLTAGDTLKGLVKYDLQQDLVQYTLHDRKAEVYTARKVLFFEIFDATVNRYRQFFALPFASGGNYKATIFFELMEEGKMTLLARERIEYKTISSQYYASYTRPVLTYSYFFLKDDGTIQEFNGSKNDLLDLMGKKADDVEKYIRKNRLRFDDKYDLARIVAYYNSLFGT